MTNHPSSLTEQIDPVSALKESFRRHASGVAIITLSDASGAPVGFTATSVTSLGANPPLFSFNVARGASSWPALLDAEHVAVHTLSAENKELAVRMAADHLLRFTPDDWTRGPHNLPVFPDASAVLIGRVRERVNVELNAVVICDVVSALIADSKAASEALLYHQRGYVKTGLRLPEAP